MSWNKVDIKSKDKNLPEVGKKVLWAVKTKTNSINKFIGCLTNPWESLPPWQTKKAANV